MDFLKVALRADLAAENMSQAAPHAIIHLIGPLSNSTFCGSARVSDVAHAGTDRVVSCPDCLSFARAARDTPADDTSLTDGAYRTLRSVSSPDYTGLERRSRPRFIEADLTINQLTNGENMKHYTNVIKDDVGSVHALYDGETATACGAINAADTMGSTRAVSCDACMKAIINQQRASDHRMPLLPGPPVLHHNFSTHMASWRKAISHLAERTDLDQGERAYWQHELTAFDLAYSTFDHSLATGGDDMPKVMQHGGPVPNTPINSIKILAYGQDGRIVQAGTRSSRNPLADFEILLNTPAQHMNATIAMREVRDIIDNCESRMIGDGSGEREYILSLDDITKLRGLRDAFIAENIIAAQKIVNDADLLEQLRQVCGYVENGSSQYVTIGQDDATREWGINVGVDHRMEKRRHYSGTSFHQAIRAAAAKEIEIEEPQPHGYADQDAAPAGAVGVSADAVVEANRKLLLDRSNVGIAKYGVTLEQSGLTLRQFVQHALEETLDLANYLQATLMTTALQDQKQ